MIFNSFEEYKEPPITVRNGTPRKCSLANSTSTKVARQQHTNQKNQIKPFDFR
jgi:hypothetical protein